MPSSGPSVPGVRSSRRLLTAALVAAGVLAAGLVPALGAGPADGAPNDPLAGLLGTTTTTAPPASQILGDGWSRVQDPDDTGAGTGRPTGAGDGWSSVSIPDVTQPEASPASYAGSVWWYRRRVSVPAAAAGAGWALRFEGVRRVASVYVDGRPLAGNDDPYSPFEVELPADTAGRTVTIVVRVDGRRPQPLSEGWWNWTGIVRPVALVPRGRVAAVDPMVQGSASCVAAEQCTRVLRVRANVRNRTGAYLPVRVRVRVTDGQGRTFASQEQDTGGVDGGATRNVAFEVPAPAARLWSPSDPALYTATVELVSGVGIEQRTVRRVGFRTVTAAGGRLQLNGRELRLRGASIQEDLPGRGAALRDEDVARIVQDLQSAGVNVTRAHYTLDERLLSALDRAGIMVWSQAPIYQTTSRLADPAYRDRALRTNERAVVASRNHPSVIVHSVANELSATVDRHPGAVDFLRRAREAAATLDPSVPAAVDLVNYPNYPIQSAYGEFPVLGLNVYFGWYDGKKGKHSTKRFADFEPHLRRLRRMYPAAAMAVTEFGAEGIRPGSRKKKGTLQFQQAYFNRMMNVIDARPDLAGALYWTVREFAIKPRWTGGTPRSFAKLDGIHRKALLTYDGRPKPVWSSAQNRLDGSLWGIGAAPRPGYGR